MSWNPVPWLTLGEAGPDQQTADLSLIVQEIVDRPGWLSGNALVIIFTGTGERVAEAFDGDENGAPLLRVRYLDSGNAAPFATITAPPDGSSAEQGDPVTLTGTATDAEDGDLSASLAWVSDRDGTLGTGASVTRSDLSVGLHAITASVTDSGGRGASDQIALAVNGPNTAPSATITAPPDGSTVAEGDPVTLSGTATDTEDGDLSASLIWVSDRDGTLGTGASVTRSDLSVGLHAITALVADSGGLAASDQIALTVNGAPEVTITAPPDGSIVAEGDPVTLTGTATDPEDGDLAADLTWRSNKNGVLGTGASITFSSLSKGKHTITASVTDSAGVAGSDKIKLRIKRVR